MFENKNILFLALGSKEWIGGLYYIKNIIFTLSKENKLYNSSVYLLVKESNIDLFSDLENNLNIKFIIYKDNIINKVCKKFTEKLFLRQLNFEILSIVKKYKIDFIYPVCNFGYAFLNDKCVFWIPDFQHVHLKEMFSDKMIHKRDKLYKYIAQNHKNLILSSYDAFNDYKNLYPKNVDNVEIQHFRCFISRNDLDSLDNNFINSVLKKYKIERDFYFLPNQFWKHKNHITVFRSIKYLKYELNTDIYLVCTGNTNDFRNKTYFEYLLQFIKDNNLQDNIKILGFINRLDQLGLMKKSIAVIQPSLFEGWSTVVEDAKVFNKKVFLSDINVNLEQKNDRCIIFEKESYIDLANKLLNQKNGRENV